MKRAITTLLASSAAIAIAMPVMAQSESEQFQDQSAQSDFGDEIVVTAQKRTERLQDVPLAVTAVSGDALARQQINDTQSLTKAVPSLGFQPGATSNGAGFRVRGVGTQLFSVGVEASVSLVVDGVVAARQTQSFSDFADIERIEVLRGPQGTLFGKNATAGVISIVTQRPDDVFGGSIEATVAEKDEYRVKGTITGPLTDTLAARVSGYYNNVGGYIRNIANGNEVNKQESWGLRGKLDWDATDTLNFLLSGDYRQSNSNCCNLVYVRIDNPNLAELVSPIVPGVANRQTNQNMVNTNKDKQWTVSLEGNLDLGAAAITSITAYQSYKNVANNPVDQLPFATPVYLPGFAISQLDLNGGTIDLSQFSQELRIASTGERDLTYVAGVFYSNTTVDREFERELGLCTQGTTLGETCVNPTYRSAFSSAHNKSESLAGFAQLEYRVSGGFKLLGGLRVQHESTSVAGYKISPYTAGSSALVTPVSGKRSASDDAVTGKAGVKYEFGRDAQVYASYTRGYKGLGFNTEMASDFATQDPVQPEHVNAYEIGFKGRTRDGSLSFAIAVYRADYTNLQISANRSDPTTGVISNVQTNAGSSRTQGVEIEATVRPVTGFSVDFGVAYTDAKVSVDGLNCPIQYQGSAPILTSDFPDNQCYRSQLANASGTLVTSGPIQNVVNGTLPYSPRWKINIAPRVETAIGSSGYTGFWQTNLNFQSKQQFAIEQDPLLVQKAYALVDMSLGLRTPDDRYSLTVFVKNLFDTHYVTSLSHAFVYASPSSPNDLLGFINKDSDRYFGATLGAKF